METLKNIFELPDWQLVLWLFFVMSIDFGSGFAKAKFLNINRTSEALKRTIKKVIQYFTAIIVVFVLINIIKFDNESNFFKTYSGVFQNVVIILMIYIEMVSILENIIAVDKDSNFSKFFIIPFHRLLTMQMKENPIYSMSREEQVKVEEKKLKMKKDIL